MREILFRAKRVDNGEWVYWNLWGELIKESGKRTRIAVKNGATTSYYDYVHQIRHLIDESTISQYIGLCDKNGKKIFENDIVTSGSDSTGRKYYSAVYYDEFNCTCCNGVYGWTFVEGCGDIREYKQYEVVGNVFDNYKLLEQPEGN